MEKILICFFALVIGTASAQNGTVWDGVYSDAQADRGGQAYTAVCARCHRADLSGYDGLLIGEHFKRDWIEDSVNSLFTKIRTTMPAGSPGSLNEATYLDIVAFILRRNSFPSGTKDLTIDALPKIRIQGQSGPEPVPDFSLVEVVGCLSQRPDNAWVVTKASEPVRTRNPAVLEGAEVEKAAGKQAGEGTFRLDDVAIYHPEKYKGNKVDAKGFLVHRPGDVSLNTTSISPVAASCEK
jgi:mono/diheme cytochrome c family protein